MCCNLDHMRVPNGRILMIRWCYILNSRLYAYCFKSETLLELSEILRYRIVFSLPAIAGYRIICYYMS
jgi:hypothetical protein